MSNGRSESQMPSTGSTECGLSRKPSHTSIRLLTARRRSAHPAIGRDRTFIFEESWHSLAPDTGWGAIFGGSAAIMRQPAPTAFAWLCEPLPHQPRQSWPGLCPGTETIHPWSLVGPLGEHPVVDDGSAARWQLMRHVFIVVRYFPQRMALVLWRTKGDDVSSRRTKAQYLIMGYFQAPLGGFLPLLTAR